jgi:hypothetical protein
MNWALMNHYDERGEMIMPRPRGKEADEEKFIRWVCVELTFEAEPDQTHFAERRTDRLSVSTTDTLNNMS